MPGFVELIAIICVLFIVFGATRMGSLGEAIGRRLHKVPRAPLDVDKFEESPARQTPPAGAP